MKKYSKIGLVVFAMLFLGANLVNVSTAQKRLGAYNHNTPAHKTGKYAKCTYCHLLPTRNWTFTRRDGKEIFPDIRTYPYDPVKKHAICNNCHTADVFGNTDFCGSCHVVPNRTARAVLPFPNKSHPTQFRTIFPHDRHQDVFAYSRPVQRDYAVAHFLQASFLADGPAPYYSCSVCHETMAKNPARANIKDRMPFDVKPVDGLLANVNADNDFRDGKPDPVDPQNPNAKPFKLVDGFFKESPENHASCFNCHYQYKNLPADKQDCSGCHQLVNVAKDKEQKQFLIKRSEKGNVERFSLKFNHNRSKHDGDCVSCHVRITQNEDVRAKSNPGITAAAEVPIITCRTCHRKSGSGSDYLGKELESRKADPKFACTSCHTSAIGIYEIPQSHR
jgi:hypothetical protein